MTRSFRAGLVAGTALLLLSATAARADTDTGAVLSTYADIALAGYEDSLNTAHALRDAIAALVADPSDVTLAAARDAWIASRVPYQQTEAYRFGNAIVDDWEGRVNAWPLDEGLIDYVDAGYGTESDANSLYTANVIANADLTINGDAISIPTITPEVIAGTLQEAGGIEANVASGYHAIEFLLWGQDLNGTGPGAGERPAADFDTSNCANTDCARRVEFLSAAADLLVADLEEMVANWTETGAARLELTEGDADAGIAAILTGMGSLSYGELAGERMKLGLLLHDPEEEHDCFSDNTHASHYYDALGVQNVYLGRYVRIDGSEVNGASLADLVAETDGALDAELQAKLDATMQAMSVMVERAEGGEAYDQMIGEGNDEGNAIVQAAIDGLIDQTRSIERVITALSVSGTTIEGSDSLDSPDAVFN